MKLFKVRFVTKVGWDVAYIEAYEESEAREKLKARFPEALSATVTKVKWFIQ